MCALLSSIEVNISYIDSSTKNLINQLRTINQFPRHPASSFRTT
jgi:hypothetical protein